MSNTKLSLFSKMALLGTLGLVLGGTAMSYYHKHYRIHRSIASIGPFQPHGLIVGKQAAAMTVEIVGPAVYPDNNFEVVELIGYLTQHLSTGGALGYEWGLPEGVELVRGPLSDHLYNLRLGQPRTVSILVRGFSREKQKLISLRTQLIIGNAPLTAAATVVSRPEDTMDAKVVDLQSQAKAAAEDVGEPKSESK